MRVLLCVHHPLDANLGAPGATLDLGAALSASGCSVDYFAFDHASPRSRAHRVSTSVYFPWHLAWHLSRRSGKYDVIDVTTGDNWIWDALGRPGARTSHALITRSHGLEHPAADRLKQFEREGKLKLSWKYPLYHGGYRLWEVTRSLRIADHVILLNQIDLQYATSRLGIDVAKISVIPHGIRSHFHDEAELSSEQRTPLRLAFVGTWIERKGIRALVEAVTALAENLQFDLSLLGTGLPSHAVLADFPPALRSQVRVVPSYANIDLPRELRGCQILLALSSFEGFGLGLVEAMSCNLVPVTTPVGIASTVIQSGVNGIVVPVGNADAITQAVIWLAEHRAEMHQMRVRARQSARRFRWDDVACQTIKLYSEVIQRKMSLRTPPAS
jgi:glycosyltransferase involved in cell wall biosynthesis